ncbi:MAG: lipoyl synthase [Gammaproteobacteria bacterium]|nr:MAG: lipoyl synthase [Gammaproteobacteria bacterium]UTW41683.1 lipoyl synthase [bacterium SCSIO 12844]
MSIIKTTVEEKNKYAKDKLSRIPVKIQAKKPTLRKPDWLKIQLPKASSGGVSGVKDILREGRLASVCEEASCPNLHECFNKGTASFMIMGYKCTRRCSFCDVAHGRPDALDQQEPENLADAISKMNLRYVVVTSVDRDDLRDGGSEHFAKCIQAIREKTPNVKVEILTPDFRGRMDVALENLSKMPPDVFNHNLETVPRLYKAARPGSDYQWSLDLLKRFKDLFPEIPTKSGLMVGLGETDEEIIEVMKDMRKHNIDMLTIGQYLQPSIYHIAVERYVSPEIFREYASIAKELGFKHVASGPMVRSSYHADIQFEGDMIA